MCDRHLRRPSHAPDIIFLIGMGEKLISVCFVFYSENKNFVFFLSIKSF